MKYFKVWVGYERFIPIEEDELPKALAAQRIGGIAVLKNGQVNGKYISLIENDYHRALGFNEGYKLLPEDYEIINRECADYKGYIESVKQEVNHMTNTGQVNKLLQ